MSPRPYRARPRRSPHTAAITALALCIGGSFLAEEPAHADTPGPDARFALVIGWNQSDDDELEPLRYADDDAIRYHELFAAITTQALLLTSPDEETEALVPDFAALAAKVPTRQNVLDAIQTLRASMQRAKAQGKRPILYFVYSSAPPISTTISASASPSWRPSSPPPTRA